MVISDSLLPENVRLLIKVITPMVDIGFLLSATYCCRCDTLNSKGNRSGNIDLGEVG